MRTKIRVDTITPAHITFTVFCNGAHCGKLTMRTEEYALFTYRMKKGTDDPDLFTIENAPSLNGGTNEPT